MPAAYLRCLGRYTRFPIRPPATLDRVYRMFDELRRSIPSPPQRERHSKAWISPETWSCIDTRIADRQRKDQRSSWDLIRAIKMGLWEDRHRWASKAGPAVDSLLAFDTPLIREAWIRIHVWYKATVERPSPPARMPLASMTVKK